MSVAQWRAHVLSLARPRESRRLTLGEAEGCVLAETVVTRHPLPPFTSSAMDGYALRAADISAACDERPVRLTVIGSVPAGCTSSAVVGLGEAVRILTGGALPSGADAVVPVEATDAGRSSVHVRSPVGVGRHVRGAGEDAPAGAEVARAGTIVGPGVVAATAAAGHADVLVVPRPRVLVISTGNELAAPGSTLTGGMVPDSNGVGIAAAVRAVGGEVCHVAGSRDMTAELQAAIAEHADHADVVVTTGGVSEGAENDVVRAAFEDTGAVRFARVSMRPGSPQAAGKVAGLTLVGLPGNPVAAAVSFAVFVRPLLRRLRGLDPLADWQFAELGVDLALAPQRTHYLLGRFVVRAGRRVVEPHVRSGSHLVTLLADAELLLAVPPGTTTTKAGSPIAVLQLDPAG